MILFFWWREVRQKLFVGCAFAQATENEGRGHVAEISVRGVAAVGVGGTEAEPEGMSMGSTEVEESCSTRITSGNEISSLA